MSRALLRQPRAIRQTSKCLFPLLWALVPAIALRPVQAAGPVVVAPTDKAYASLAFGDLNGDGLRDLIAGSADGAGVKAFYQGASRAWNEMSGALPNSGIWSAVALGDVDRNGLLDAVVGAATNEGLRCYKQTSAGVWAASSTGLAGTANKKVSAIALLDLNFDGDLDIVVSFASNHGIHIFHNNGSASWSDAGIGQPTLAGAFGGLALWDWSGDGFYDLVGSSQDDLGLIYWRYNNATGAWVSSDYNLPSVGVFHQLAISDANRDGRLDLLATGAKGARAFSGRDPQFPSISTGLLGAPAMAGIAAGDYPPDGKTDFFAGSAGNTGAYAFSGLESGRWIRRADPFSSGDYPALAMNDCDGDGAQDLAAASSTGGIHLIYNAPVSLDAEWIEGPAPAKAGAKGARAACADVNRDGAMDMMIGSEGSGLLLFRGSASGVWTDVTPVSFSSIAASSFSAVAFGDFSGDLWPDAIAASSDGNGLYAFKSLGFQGWTAARAGLPVSGIYYSAILADINSDGRRELIAGHKTDGIKIYRFNAATSTWLLVAPSPLSTGETRALAAGDFDGDGWLDLAASVAGVGMRCWKQTAGGGGWSVFETGLPHTGTVNALLQADMNLDGRADLVAARSGVGIAAYRNKDGAGNWNQLSLPAAGAGFVSLDCADFDLDGRPDLVACGGATGVHLLRNMGGGTAWSRVLAGDLPSASAFNFVLFARLDQDAAPDIAALDDADFAQIFLAGDGTPPGDWALFTPADWVKTVAATACSVQVSEAISGLDVESARYEYSINGGSAWLGPFPAVCSDPTSGVLTTTILAAAVPFGQQSGSLNKIRFFIDDTTGNSGQSPDYTVRIDATAPLNPTALDSFAHAVNVWSRFRRINVEWSGASDTGGSGVKGYSYAFTQSPSTVPDTTIDTLIGVRTARSDVLADAANWYFHCRAIDFAGNAAGGAYHRGPFKIDSAPPAPPLIACTSHTAGVYSNDPSLDLVFTPGADAAGGVSSIRYMVNEYDSTRPLSGMVTTDFTQTATVAEGHNWHVHAQTIDEAGNVSDAAHLGPFRIDRTPPGRYIRTASISGTSDFNVEWGGMDALSGLDYFNVQYRNVTAGDTSWTDWRMGTSSYSAMFSGVAGTTYAFRVQSVDVVGNASTWTSEARTQVGKHVTVTVRDTAGNPISGAEVFHNDNLVGNSNAAGTIVVPDVLHGDSICARKRIASWLTDRPNRGWGSTHNWMARAWIHSAGYDRDTGEWTGVRIDDAVPPDTRVLTIRKNQALIGFYIVVSIEWDASYEYIQSLLRGFEGASDYLLMATDGQFYFERVAIFDCKHEWTYADIRIHNSNVWPNAYTGWPTWVMNQRWSNAQIRMPSLFNGTDSYQGSYANSNGFRTFVHEFGHYGLRLKDEYFRYVWSWSDFWYVKRDRHCTLNLTHDLAPYGCDQPLSASVMDSQFDSENFCDDVSGNAHNTDTDHHFWRGKTTWKCIKEDWSDEDTRWRLYRPGEAGVGRYGVGPYHLPSNGWRTVAFDYDGHTGAFDAHLTVQDADSNPVENASVTLYYASGGHRNCGLTNSAGEIWIVGAREGDRAVATWDGGTQEFEMTPPASPRSRNPFGEMLRFDTEDNAIEALREMSQTIQLAPPASTARLAIRAEPGASSSTLELAVSSSEELIEAPSAMIWQNDEDGEEPLTPALVWNAASSAYEASVQLDATSALRGWILVKGRDLRGNETLGSKWFEFLPDPYHATMYLWESHKGDLQFFAPNDSLPAGGKRLYVEQITTADDLPTTFFVVKGPYRLAAQNGADLRGPANLTIAFARQADEAYEVVPGQLAIYARSQSGGGWNKLPSVYVEIRNEVDAPISGLGDFVLGGPIDTSETSARQRWAEYR